MKKEILARIIVILFILIAVAIPFAGQWLFSRNKTDIIELHARMPENGGWSIDQIDAEVNEPIHLRMTSDDVVHGIAIGKSDLPGVDIYPGEFVETTFVFDQPGQYTFYCTRWCGPNHWRMRGTIDVSGEGRPLQPEPQPLFVTLDIDIDSPTIAETVPNEQISAERGAYFASLLPTYAIDRTTYLSTSPAVLWMRLRAESALSNLSDQDIWDAVAWIWQGQTTPENLENGQRLYTENCAACHGETGKGDGVMVRNNPVWDPGNHNMDKSSDSFTGEGLVRPRDFSDPKNLLGTSPALLEGKIIRGGMGTGMPYWGPIFTSQQIENLVSYLFNFAWGFTPNENLD
jgi:mono/diheme cytochrome c family protein